MSKLTLNDRYLAGITLVKPWIAACQQRLKDIQTGALPSEFHPDTRHAQRMGVLAKGASTGHSYEAEFKRVYAEFIQAQETLAAARKVRMEAIECYPLPTITPVKALRECTSPISYDKTWPAIVGRAWCDGCTFVDTSLFPVLGAVGKKMAGTQPHNDQSLGGHLNSIFERMPADEHEPTAIIGARLYADQPGFVITRGLGSNTTIFVEMDHARFALMMFIRRVGNLKMTMTRDRGMFLRDASRKVMAASMPIHGNRNRLPQILAVWESHPKATNFLAQ